MLSIPHDARFSDLLRQVEAAGWEWQGIDLDEHGFTWTFTCGSQSRRVTDANGAAGLRTFLAMLEREQSQQSGRHRLLQRVRP